MNNSTIVIILFSLGIFAVTSSFDTLDNDGKAGRTGSPGESTCNITCHTGFILNDGTGSITITSPNNPTWEYFPGDTFDIDVTVTRLGNSLFGVDVECLTAISPQQNAGTIIITNPTTMTFKTNTVSSVIRKNLVHKLNGGIATNSKTFSFKWVSPNTDIGPVTFYATGNAANGNNLTSGDHIYKTSQVLTPAVGANIYKPSTKEGFSIFPNPAHDNISILCNVVAGEKVSVQLISIDGKIVSILNETISDGIPMNLKLALPDALPQGIYLVQLIHGNSTDSQRIIIE